MQKRALGHTGGAARERAEADHLTKFLERYERTAPRLVQWAEENLPQGFTVFDFPPSYRRYAPPTCWSG